MAEEKKWDVSTPSARYSELESKRKIHRDLLGGTSSMREAGEEWLPRESQEDDDDYRKRLARSVLYNGYKRTIDFLAGKVFRKPLRLSPTAPDFYSPIADDIDLTGRNMHRFCWDLFKSGLSNGISFIFVDLHTNGAPPRETVSGRRIVTSAGSSSARPYWTMIDPSRIFRFVFGSIGSPRLLRVHITFDEVVSGGEGGHWAESTEQAIRVYYASGVERSDGAVSDVCSYEVWRFLAERGEKARWVLTESHEMPPIKDIPLVPFYANYSGYMDAEPEFEDLAWLQWSHWYKRSDFDNTMHYSAGVPTLALPGFQDLEASGIAMGAMRTILTPSENSRPYWLEVSGNGLRLLKGDITELETRILLLGLQPLMSKPSSGQLVTATERLIDQENVDNQLEAYALSLKDTIDLAMEFSSRWMSRADWPGTSAIEMQDDYSFNPNSEVDKQFLLQMRGARDLSREGLLSIAKKFGIIPDEFDVDDDMKRILAESEPATEETAPTPATDGGDGGME